MEQQNNVQQSLTREEMRIFGISAIGGALEFYDFIVYIFFAQVLAQLFFNATSTVSSLLLSFSVFATGYVARLFGGLVF
ncbi:MAG: MFS transporter, partial [Bdellovibrionota bacterium]